MCRYARPNGTILTGWQGHFGIYTVQYPQNQISLFGKTPLSSILLCQHQYTLPQTSQPRASPASRVCFRAMRRPFSIQQ